MTTLRTPYTGVLLDDYLLENNETLMSRNMDDTMTSRVYSEIEGTLRIENVPTTRKRIEDICNNKPLLDKNDIIIHNMIQAIDYISSERPAFNRENLFKLYNILSDQCLDDEDKLREGNYYRHDAVHIEEFEGAPYERINSMMDSLFDFVNNTSGDNPYYSLLPHICHYYMIYVHPYFDYNGRTARMVSFWISTIFNIDDAPKFISEAINENKCEYYQAIRDSRVANNDITYFLGYVMKTSVKFSLVYKNLEHIENVMAESGEFLTKSDKINLKKVMLHNASDYFNYKMFNKYIDSNLTKQRSLKILNDMTDAGLLTKKINAKKEAAYKLNPELLKYNI